MHDFVADKISKYSMFVRCSLENDVWRFQILLSVSHVKYLRSFSTSYISINYQIFTVFIFQLAHSKIVRVNNLTQGLVPRDPNFGHLISDL